HETAPEAALESQLQGVIAATNCANRLEAQFTSAGQPWPLAPAQLAELRRLTLEAVANVLKHAHAKHLEIRLDYRPDQLVLEVLDDGFGFDPAATRPDLESVGLGLVSMRHRAAKLGASFHVFSAAEQGTRVRVVVPRPQ
ncbi:MAG TPA: ATP-binding protein, partial [Candidatus Paceibacterota bacterium]|nr:ATP-binding protein [Candidatus Paceibacterota bacterium]